MVHKNSQINKIFGVCEEFMLETQSEYGCRGDERATAKSEVRRNGEGEIEEW